MTDQQKKYKEIACAFLEYNRLSAIKYSPELYDRWIATEEGKRLTAPDDEVAELRAWKESMIMLWGPVISYAQDNKLPGLDPGQSISEYVLKRLTAEPTTPEKLIDRRLDELNDQPESPYDLLVKISGQLDRMEGNMKLTH
jgi:hypothetical protein